MKNFNGNVFFIDRNDINTDEIIPAKYLTEIDKKNLKPHLLEDLKDFKKESLENKQVVISRANFGCGSSREHAPWAFETNNINIVIAENFARIFKQNMFNCGMLAIELPKKEINQIFKDFYKEDNVQLETNLDKKVLTIKSPSKTKKINFSISSFEADLIKAGGWLFYAKKKY